ncbi:hypothetical protein [Microbispora sp. NPDC049125]|uniref:hypothetical protein n=1 Tax=Microbispora sp. NPDC049125 TaxID=3154929 RepID=UPI0034668B84
MTQPVQSTRRQELLNSLNAIDPRKLESIRFRTLLTGDSFSDAFSDAFTDAFHDAFHDSFADGFTDGFSDGPDVTRLNKAALMLERINALSAGQLVAVEYTVAGQ